MSFAISSHLYSDNKDILEDLPNYINPISRSYSDIPNVITWYYLHSICRFINRPWHVIIFAYKKSQNSGLLNSDKNIWYSAFLFVLVVCSTLLSRVKAWILICNMISKREINNGSSDIHTLIISLCSNQTQRHVFGERCVIIICAGVTIFSLPEYSMVLSIFPSH